MTDNTRIRGNWNEIIEWPKWVAQIVNEAEKAGSFTRGIESDRKQRGSAINVDLFGYDEKQNLAVIQVRECIFHPRRYNRVRKDYYLIGHTEQGNPFTHPVDTPARSKWAMETPENTIAFVLSKIWQCRPDELHLIVRQGDVAFVPDQLPKGAELVESNMVVLRETHKITGKIWKKGSKYYCERARMVHTKRQHATVQVKDMIYRIQEGIRASVWGFTSPVGD